MKSLTFNGIKKDWIYLLRGRTKPPFASVRRNLLTVPGMPGVHLQSSDVQPLPINQPVGFVIKDDKHALQLKDELASWLITDEPVPLEFDDEPGRTYFAIVQNTMDDFDKFAELRQGTIQFLCLDPYSYGPEQITTFTSDIETLTNEGTADADPIFELEVLTPITFAMIQNQNNEYMMIGRPVTADDIAYQPQTSILSDAMNSLVGWTDATYVDNGTISGTMATDTEGFYASDFGTGTGWHGPAVKTSLTESLQDFNAQIHVENLNLSGGMGMIEVYFLDANENTVAKLGIEDAWKDVANMQAKFQLGNPADRHQQYGQPAKASDWYDYRGIMRISREGQNFNAYFAVIKDGKYKHARLFQFTDYENKYQAPIAQIQVAIRRRSAEPTSMRVNHIYVNKINQEPNGVPYIADVGDIITLDHSTSEVLINGEYYEDIALGSDFFKLKQGENTLSVQPSNSFNTSAKYRERYK
ncbi:distal tail protein Dit [Oceanobacillus salinisoli]|uniref:distal tail protein Dit n=1 Tax=Oceanobacillus salinisoli TaxID=2678611 RepID=UPI0012E25E15|nr:distal tail protein Dit [Oceanobacillus salinisoli]